MRGNADSLGSLLRQEREQHQVSLRDISAATKIQIRFLEAIERDEYDRLPPTPFVVGFLRAYAQCIDLDADEVVAAYYALYGRAEERRAPQVFGTEQVPRPGRAWRLGVGLAGGVLLLVLGAAWWYMVREQHEAPPVVSTAVDAIERPAAVEASAVATPEVPAQLPPATSLPLPQDMQPGASAVSEEGGQSGGSAPAVDTTGSAQRVMATLPSNSATAVRAATPVAPAAAPTPAVDAQGAVPTALEAQPGAAEPAASAASVEVQRSPLVLEVKALADTWLEVEIDGVKQRPFTLASGKSERWEATKRVVMVTIGNAHGTQLVLNGQEVSLPATRSNIVRNFVLTHDSIH